MSLIHSFDIDGSARGAEHTIPVGTPVIVTRGGVVQPWADAVILRHDRNGTYRLHFTETDTYTTVHSGEIAPR